MTYPLGSSKINFPPLNLNHFCKDPMDPVIFVWKNSGYSRHNFQLSVWHTQTRPQGIIWYVYELGRPVVMSARSNGVHLEINAEDSTVGAGGAGKACRVGTRSSSLPSTWCWVSQEAEKKPPPRRHKRTPQPEPGAPWRLLAPGFMQRRKMSVEISHQHPSTTKSNVNYFLAQTIAVPISTKQIIHNHA